MWVWVWVLHVHRKEECEQQLQQLEKSIEKLSKKYVYVHDDETF